MLSLEEILENMEKDITYHEAVIDLCEVGSKSWDFHSGYLNGLLAYRWQIKELLLNEK